MAAPLTKAEREQLVGATRKWGEKLSPMPDDPQEYRQAKEGYYDAMEAYFERLPRVPMSVCPFCDQPLLRSFDPHGLDGFWWHVEVLCEVDEPEPCEHFQVLLGALNLGGRTPVEVREEVRPGPELVFVVPDLLELAGMIAVVGALQTDQGDVAYPVAYFTDEPVDRSRLHQPWLRESFWFETEEGHLGWSISTARWDFNLTPWLLDGRLRWTDLAEDPPQAHTDGPGHKFPYIDRPGEVFPQRLAWGKRSLLDLPSGEPLDPFE